MSRSDLLTCSLTVVAMFVSYFVGGRNGNIGAVASLILCVVFLVAFRAVGMLNEPIPKESEAESRADHALNESDPRIYVEIIDGRRDLGTPFVLYNRGGGDACDVQIRPIILTEGTATFGNITSIVSGEKEERLPEIESEDLFYQHDFTALLFHEWMLRTNLTVSELPVRGIVTYSDLSRRNQFATSFEITFYPSEETAPSEWGDRLKMVEATKCETRRLVESESGSFCSAGTS